MTITIHAAPSAIWPWLVQMGQGRGGFYTHEWVENLLGADIRNANRLVSEWQQLEVGEQVRLTPDPNFGQQGQFMTVAELQPERALVFRQTLPNGSVASWAFLLLPGTREQPVAGRSSNHRDRQRSKPRKVRQANPLMLANGPAGLFSTSAADPTIAVMPIRTPAQPSQDENARVGESPPTRRA